MNGDKLIEELPRVRVSEQMWGDLTRMAAVEDRSLSDLVRVALAEWLYGHTRKVRDESER